MVYLLPCAGVSGLSACPLSKLQISEKAFATASTLGTPSACSKSTPLARCHRVAPVQPPPDSNIWPVAGGLSLHNNAMSGAT